ncbi:MAG: LPXTG cell wall anchor domain-containing protein, partial [Oscillospiraceae bacterium]|nr:LPXTG cell wall anchor domain-containing protein [Oscillospiraceae bacterium]
IYEALTGAEFTLEKYNKATDSWIAIDQVETTAGAVFTFEGLDDGNYRLTETETPDGYNSIEPIEFTVTADHDIVWETQIRTEVLNSLSGNVTTGEIEFTVDTAAGPLSSDVENMAGIELPETGGIGTTIFYIVGGLLVAAAVILLVTKKRMSSAK